MHGLLREAGRYVLFVLIFIGGMALIDWAYGVGALPWIALALAIGVIAGVAWLSAQERNR